MKPAELKTHVKAEKKALQKGGASKKLMAQERAEYAREGVKFANGGAVKARATVKSHGKAWGC